MNMPRSDSFALIATLAITSILTICVLACWQRFTLYHDLCTQRELYIQRLYIAEALLDAGVYEAQRAFDRLQANAVTYTVPEHVFAHMGHGYAGRVTIGPLPQVRGRKKRVREQKVLMVTAALLHDQKVVMLVRCTVTQDMQKRISHAAHAAHKRTITPVIIDYVTVGSLI